MPLSLVWVRGSSDQAEGITPTLAANYETVRAKRKFEVSDAYDYET